MKTLIDMSGPTNSLDSLQLFVTGSVKTGLIAHDKKFDFTTQTQSLMNALSNITATDNQNKGICFF